MRVGILGGVFNPPHLGHVVGAQEALVQLELEKVVFMPVGQAPHRELESDPGAEARFEMVELATGDDARFAISRAELDRPGPSYTADTLRELREKATEDDLFLILGGDQAAALPSWHEPETVLSLATVAVVERATGRATRSGSRSEGCRARSGSATSTCRSSRSRRARSAAGCPRGSRSAISCRTRWRYIGANGLYGAEKADPAQASKAVPA